MMVLREGILSSVYELSCEIIDGKYHNLSLRHLSSCSSGKRRLYQFFFG
jgi:hypothetical protein